MLRRLLFSLFGLLFLAGTAQAAVSVRAIDSIAGEDVTLRIAGLLADEDIDVRLTRPDGTGLNFALRADDFGVVHSAIHGLHTRRAGDYSIGFQHVAGGAVEDFKIFAGPVSAYRSEIVLDESSLMADGASDGTFSIALKDRFGNAVAGQSVNVFSSRQADRIELSGASNADGEIVGTIASALPGVSTLSALAGETILFDRPEVVFFLSGDFNLESVGSDGMSEFLKTQLFEDDGGASVEYFSLEQIPTEATVDEQINIKVVAKDGNGDIVNGYTGTVRFSSSDDRATLPADYQFTTDDQGQHAFYLAVSFGTPGPQTLAVHDMGDFRISGEFEVNVSLSGSGINVPEPVDSIRLTSPQPGLYSSPRATITGESSGVAIIKLLDGTNVLAETLEVDGAGNFVFQTPPLAEGTHVFQGVSLDGTVLSNTIEIRIDRSAPSEISVRIDPPENIAPGTQFRVIATSSEPLSTARCLFREILTDLQASDNNEFIGSFTAPLEGGESPLSCTIADVLGNELDEPTAAVVQVTGCGEDVVDGGAGDGGTGGDGGHDPGAGNDKDLPPSAISNLSAESGEGKVTLYWSPATDDYGVKNYRVEFTSIDACSEDQQPDSDTLFFESSNLTPDDRTRWYIDGLQDDRKYFFRVIATDTFPQNGPASDVIESVTLGNQGFHCAAPVKLEKSGPGSSLPTSWLWMLGLVLGGGMILFAKKNA